MAAPVRIQLSRAKGWRMPAGTVKVDRTTVFGNPYLVGEPVDMKQVRRWGWNFDKQGRTHVCADVQEAINRFCYCLAFDEAIHPFVREKLGGKNLACWCALDAPCHADYLMLLANS